MAASSREFGRLWLNGVGYVSRALIGYERRTAEAPPRRSARGKFGRTLVLLEASMAVAALGGAIALVAWSIDAMPADVLARTPFPVLGISPTR